MIIVYIYIYIHTYIGGMPTFGLMQNDPDMVYEWDGGWLGCHSTPLGHLVGAIWVAAVCFNAALMDGQGDDGGFAQGRARPVTCDFQPVSCACAVKINRRLTSHFLVLVQPMLDLLSAVDKNLTKFET